MSRRLRTLIILAALALAGGGSLWLAGRSSREPGHRSDRESAAGTNRAVGSFHPKTRREGNLLVMPITFPDGTAAELAFPDSLGIDSFQVRPHTGGRIEESVPAGARETFALFQGRGWLGDNYLSPIEAYEGVDGHPVRFVEAPPDDPADLYLVFEFGSWTVLMPDHRDPGLGLTDDERQQWATLLSGEETEDGFLTLTAHPPLTLYQTSETLSPHLIFENGDRTIEFFPGPCEPYESGTPAGFERDGLIHMRGLVVSFAPRSANWCDPKASMIVQVEHLGADGHSFIRRVISELRIRNVRFEDRAQAD